nr:lebercilin [Osmia lignaria]
MQTEVPTLPVVHFNTHKNLNRKQNSNLGKSVETKCSLPQKNITCLSSKKKNLHPLLGQPYQVNIRQQHFSEQSKLNKSSIEQRVLSAKMLRIKELQNQLADAHYQLNELSNENKLLKSLQKRQDSALKRYEGTNAELPRIINSHHEELRVLQIKYKKLKALQKETCDLLKEKENELQQLQCQNKHLLQLSKDRNLEERDKLQLQVSDLHHRIQQQQDTIQTLHRKLTLESKSLKHQLHTEISKRKETQKNLDEATEKLRGLENLLDNREHRLYSSGQLQLLFRSKNRRLGTQSLTNLRDISSSNPLKLPDKCKKWQIDVQDNTLPVLHSSELNDKNIKENEEVNSNQTLNSVRSETMANLEQVRKYRLQKSLHRRTSSNDSEEKFKEPDFTVNENSKISINLQNLQESRKQEENVNWQYEMNTDKLKKIYKNKKYQNLNKTLDKELSDSSANSGSENESENFKNNYVNTANSRQLHKRLISNTDDTEHLKELIFSEYKDKFKVQDRKDSYKSNSETEFELQEESVKHHFLINNQNDTLKLISSICDDQIQIKNAGDQYNVAHTEQEDTNSENVEKYILDQTKRQEYSHITQNDFETESLLQTLESKDELWNQNAASFITYNELESKMPHVNENLFKDLQTTSTKDPLNVSKNLDEKEDINKIETSEIEIRSKNILIENSDVETKNKLNKQDINTESKNVETLLNDVKSYDSNSIPNTSVDVNTTNKISTQLKPANYIKEQLLASMKAIDDNENIEFFSPDHKKHMTNRKQITENLFHGLPTHMKKKQDIIKDIFDTDMIKNESIGSCNKLH